MNVIRTDSNDTDFLKLVDLLNAELAKVDGEDHSFYSQYNSLEEIRKVVLYRDDSNVVGCGGLKSMNGGQVEIKRMYVRPEKRGMGIAGVILKELEDWARELGNQRVVLETGKRLPQAIRLYERYGYKRIPNYEPYIGIENSVCFEKFLFDVKGRVGGVEG